MPGIHISKTLIRKLPEEEQEGIEDFLWSKSGKKCHLCEQPLNKASDEIEADHDDPESEGGETTRTNLKLAHRECNRAKRNSKTVDVRPYLKFSAFVRNQGNLVQYAQSTSHFGINPSEVAIEVDSESQMVNFDLPDGSSRNALLHSEKNRKCEYEFCFVDVPRNALHNDPECQPRNIKLAHLWAIYVDLQKNPLHEPPGCRLQEIDSGNYKLLMFDGQHKTVASWMRGYERIVVKVYLDLDKDQTITLVNSIQAKIKKLPLSPFELSAKLAEEWRNQLNLYEDQIGSEKISETGFILWLPQTERNRGKAALKEAVFQDYLNNDELLISKYVIRQGMPKTEDSLITEGAFKNKFLARLLHLKPLDLEGEELMRARRREQTNIVRVLNFLSEIALDAEVENEDLPEELICRRKRMTYQSSLAYMAYILYRLVLNVLVPDEDSRAFIEKDYSDEAWNKIQIGVQRLVNHPIWTADLSISEKTKAVDLALSKNQDANNAFKAVGLTPGYLVGADELPPNWSS